MSQKIILDDIEVSRAIIHRYFKKLTNYLEVDVAIAGAGPSGLTAAYYLAKKNKKVAIFERKLSLGGGMWGGGMMFNEIVVGPEGKKILDEMEIKSEIWEDNYFTADSVECVATMASCALKAGAKIFNLVSVEDLMFDGKSVTGIVINWSAVEMAGLHVDPISVRADFVVDATGHPLQLVHTLVNKNDIKLTTSSGSIEGERSMFAHEGELTVVENTTEIFPHLFVAGMAANAVHGGYRMGPIFGGMLSSGKRVAELISERLNGKV